MMGRKSYLNHSIILSFLFFILVQPAFSAVNQNDFTREKILGFTRKLISQKEYYRASVELNRFQSFYPQSITPLAYNVTSLYLFHKAGRYDLLLDSGKPGNFISPGYIIASDSAIYMDRFDLASTYLDLLFDSQLYSENINYLYSPYQKRKFLLSLFTGKEDDAIRIMKKIKSDEFRLYNQLYNNYRESEKKRKNQWLALALGFVPGMGYIYSGSETTGIVALAVIAISTVTSFFAFKTGNTATGLVLGTIGTFFYGGNILGGYLEARRNNRQNREQMKNRMMQDFFCERDIDMIYNKYGLGYE